MLCTTLIDSLPRTTWGGQGREGRRRFARLGSYLVPHTFRALWFLFPWSSETYDVILELSFFAFVNYLHGLRRRGNQLRAAALGAVCPWAQASRSLRQVARFGGWFPPPRTPRSRLAVSQEEGRIRAARS
jgi:hypothetical protein